MVDECVLIHGNVRMPERIYQSESARKAGALREKGKGNEYFRSKEYKRAVKVPYARRMFAYVYVYFERALRCTFAPTGNITSYVVLCPLHDAHFTFCVSCLTPLFLPFSLQRHTQPVWRY
jgi:hypothetical protein